ncbi:hypothetical protein [Nocardiopsis ganjiahuensis]|uniref:hypothetical protein n=1 Tax=Nocardiopsis ganjiahuensis TaxID=239984 RepID=UPI00034D4317|nr:hypothetical protein [Nocardiopsis ganjiahuensis]
MHPSPPSGPDQPHGQGQPSQHLQQGGQGYPQPPQQFQQGGQGYPQPPLPQAPGQNPGPGRPYGVPGSPVPPPPQFNGSPGSTDAMPGQALAVRILMFIGGPCGIILFFVVAAVTLFGVGLTAAAGAAAQVDSPTAALGTMGAMGAVGALIPLAYGVASIWIAAVMGRRTPKVHRAVVIFNIAALAVLALNIVLMISMGAGGASVLIPVVFHGVMTGLMFAPNVRAFYNS